MDGKPPETPAKPEREEDKAFFASFRSYFRDDPNSLRDIANLLTQEPEVETDNPYSRVLYGLACKHYDEEEARFLWEDIVRHKLNLQARLGRTVSIKVAALDYLEQVEQQVEDIQFVESTDLEKIQTKAKKDGLTRVYTYGFFQERVKKAFEQARREGQPLGLLIVDLDDFKQINDRHGHQAGDRALMELARTIRSELRATDLPARYGGDEFLVLLPSTTPDETLEIARRLRRGVAAHFKSGEEVLRSLTVSVGAASLDEDVSSPQDLLRKADIALYEVKRSGKNAVGYMGKRFDD